MNQTASLTTSVSSASESSDQTTANPTKPTVFLGADHGGFALKEQAKVWLKEWGYVTQDVGAFTLDPEDDYPEFAFALAERVAAQENAVGLLFCRSGGGMIIAANKVPGISAVPVYAEQEAKHAKEHNNANIISLAGDWTTADQAKAIIQTFLETPFSHEERHQRRVSMINDYQRHQESTNS